MKQQVEKIKLSGLDLIMFSSIKTFNGYSQATFSVVKAFVLQPQFVKYPKWEIVEGTTTKGIFKLFATSLDKSVIFPAPKEMIKSQSWHLLAALIMFSWSAISLLNSQVKNFIFFSFKKPTSAEIYNFLAFLMLKLQFFDNFQQNLTNLQRHLF